MLSRFYIYLETKSDIVAQVSCEEEKGYDEVVVSRDLVIEQELWV